MSSPARMCISVDLPEPGRPHDRGELARAARRPRRRAARRPPCRRRRSAASRRARRRPTRFRSPRSLLLVGVSDRQVARARTAQVRVTLHLSGMTPTRQARSRRYATDRGQIRRSASASTSPRIPTISSISASPATSGGEIWTTGSPRSSARQIRPASNSAGERKPRSSDSHSASSNVSLVSLSLTSSMRVEEARAADVADDRRGRAASRASPGTHPRSRARARRSARAS